MPHGVGVVVSSGAGAVVEVGSPGIGLAGVGEELGHSLADLLVAGSAGELG